MKIFLLQDHLSPLMYSIKSRSEVAEIFVLRDFIFTFVKIPSA
jgi:hypothetical protein